MPTSFAPPARRGDFLYTSILYADPGNSNHHPRASVAELAALLRPEAPNLYSKGKVLHYGLPVTKEKNAAKVRLLNVMNQFKLEVPTWVLSVKADLKREREAENRKLKKAGTVGVGASAKVVKTAAKATKAKQQSKQHGVSTASNEVNVTVNLMLPSHLSVAGDSAMKKPLLAKRKRADDDVASSGTPKKAARAQKETKAKKEPAPKKEPATKKQPTVNNKPAVKKATSVKKEPKVKKETTQRAAPIVKQELPDSYQRTITLSGIYEIRCEVAYDEFGVYDLDLSLSADPNRGVWWATFRWDAWVGIFQIEPSTDLYILSQPCELGWRMRDLETGQLTFGRNCTGDIEFSAGQTLSGELYGMPISGGMVEFSGRRLPGAGVQDDLQHEWDGFVKGAYGR